MVSAPATLRALEERGFDLGSQLVGTAARSAQALAERPAYRVLAAAVAEDVAADRRRDAAAGIGMRYAHRQFNPAWLRSEKVRWELIAVVNRLDRRPFAPEHCGEIRFVYRLAYTENTATGVVSSRLPMTLNLVRFQPRGGAPGGEPSGSEPRSGESRSGERTCRDVARAWMGGSTASEDAAWLTAPGGPLEPRRVRTLPLKSVELNYQSVRWPSTVRPRLGGHAEYGMRVFRPKSEAPYLEPAPLENTIDRARLAKDRSLREELRAWLSRPESLAALDAGTLVVPERFLADHAVSVAPHGLERKGNRPFAATFTPKDFANLDFSGLTSVRSAASMIRRLDGLSCPGCHHSRSLAGFHLLGEDAPDKLVDALRVPMSPHFHTEVWRRRAYVAALASGRAVDEARPPAERAPNDNGVGAHCGLGDPAYATWTCAPGLRCTNTGDPEVGTCLPADGPSVGDACEHGTITGSDAHHDTTKLARVACQGERVCEQNSVGFPDGMCAGACTDLPEGAICGGIPLLTEFNGCLARGRSFESCILENTRPGALRACSFHEPCRDDYICARANGGGACMPPYFLFQLRVDGHPI